MKADDFENNYEIVFEIEEDILDEEVIEGPVLEDVLLNIEEVIVEGAEKVELEKTEEPENVIEKKGFFKRLFNIGA